MDVACYYLDGNADAVEFCPHYPFTDIFAAATYTLQEGPHPNRSGSISLFSADSDAGIRLLHCVQTTGVFDIKWNAGQSCVKPLLAQADADGCLHLYSLDSDTDTVEKGTVLRDFAAQKVSSSMCLCVDWDSSAQFISLGLSDGSVSIVAVRESQLQVLQEWLAHDFELWTAVFNAYQPQLLYTGADDCYFSCWDLRENSKLVFKDRKSHKMGICCIAQSPTDSNMLLTGSYDEFLRVWDVRATSAPVNKLVVSLGGGVWRIKHHPSMSGIVLAACMHNGFAIVKIGEENADVLETYNKHESLAYGADWQRGFLDTHEGSKEQQLVATCSFYDRCLRIWKPDTVFIK